MKKLALIISAIFMISSLNVFAETKEDVVKFVNEAIDYLKKECPTADKKKCYDTFSDPKGKFVKGEMYIYIFDKDAKMLAHGANKGLIGQNLMALKRSFWQTICKRNC